MATLRFGDDNNSHYHLGLVITSFFKPSQLIINRNKCVRVRSLLACGVPAADRAEMKNGSPFVKGLAVFASLPLLQLFPVSVIEGG
jgi:hypothetical protein